MLRPFTDLLRPEDLFYENMPEPQQAVHSSNINWPVCNISICQRRKDLRGLNITCLQMTGSIFQVCFLDFIMLWYVIATVTWQRKNPIRTFALTPYQMTSAIFFIPSWEKIHFVSTRPLSHGTPDTTSLSVWTRRIRPVGDDNYRELPLSCILRGRFHVKSVLNCERCSYFAIKTS